MTQNEMAQALGLTKGTVSLYHKKGMPLTDIYAANRWRMDNMKPRKVEPVAASTDTTGAPIKLTRPSKPAPPVDHEWEAETARSMRESLQWARQAERIAVARLLRAGAKPLGGESDPNWMIHPVHCAPVQNHSEADQTREQRQGDAATATRRAQREPSYTPRW